MKIFIAHASAFDFRTKLYEPLRASHLATQHEIILPEERGATWNTKETISGSDVFVIDVSAPSTGAGIELGWADAARVPVIAIHERGTVPSTVIQYLTNTLIEYDGPDDLIQKLSETLTKVSAQTDAE